jgi:hypothetical protein
LFEAAIELFEAAIEMFEAAVKVLRHCRGVMPPSRCLGRC